MLAFSKRTQADTLKVLADIHSPSLRVSDVADRPPAWRADAPIPRQYVSYEKRTDDLEQVNEDDALPTVNVLEL